MYAKLCSLACAVTLIAGSAAAQKFYPDDPLEAEPPLWPTVDPQTRALSDILETFNHTFGTPGEGHPERGVIPAGGVNTLGEVMDGAWYVNRHARHHYSEDGLKRGPGDDRPPADGEWQVLTVKQFGFRPGILIADSTGQIYLLRFDPPGWLEMATGAEMVTSTFLYALGYFVPEAYIVYFERDRLVLAEGSERVTSAGDTKDLNDIDVDSFLDDAARDPQREYVSQWSLYDNQADTHQRIGVASTDRDLPPLAMSAEEGTYIAAQFGAGEEDKTVTAYLRKSAVGFDVVGIDRGWPGKLLADSALDLDTGVSRFGDLEPIQKELFESYNKTYNEETGFDLTPPVHFNQMTVSERTTYEAVTHALMNSSLTDESGDSLGNAIDLLTGVERIAGQYYGRSGDQQFRLYVFLDDDARTVLEASQEFALGHLNTVYHVGYPYSFRQGGTLPSIQFSISEDGDRADIDVDYRSSKMPQAMFNGHLTSSNSDVRAGDNHDKHVGRWGGFVAWWRDVFGNLDHQDNEAGPSLLSRQPKEAPTPLPPDRPFGADPANIEDAAQEFLTDWLVRDKVDESLQFMSDRALACVDTDDDVDDEILRDQGVVAALRDAMEHSVDELGSVSNLTEAIDVVLPWRESIRVVDHAFDGDFAVLELTDGDAAVYLCNEPPNTPDPDAYGTYYATLFRFKRTGAAILGILWVRESGKWRIVAWEAFEQ